MFKEANQTDVLEVDVLESISKTNQEVYNGFIFQCTRCGARIEASSPPTSSAGGPCMPDGHNKHPMGHSWQMMR
mgnify:CR=1 FL=1|jgi:hypothetical protein